MTDLPTISKLSSGKYVDILNLNPEDISIDDIANALGKICRFNGQCNVFYSVAEHSVHVANLVPDHLKLHALMHDGHEGVPLSDIPTPVVNAIIRRMPEGTGVYFKNTLDLLKHEIDVVLYEAIGIPFKPTTDYEELKIIKEADEHMLNAELDMCFHCTTQTMDHNSAAMAWKACVMREIYALEKIKTHGN